MPRGIVVKVSDCGARGPGFDPRSRQDFFFAFFHMDTKEIEVVKNHWPIDFNILGTRIKERKKCLA